MAPYLEAGPISTDKLLEQLNKIVTQRRDVQTKLVQSHSEVSEAAVINPPVNSDMKAVLNAIEKLTDNAQGSSASGPVPQEKPSVPPSVPETQVLLNVIEKLGQQMNSKTTDSSTERILEFIERKMSNNR